MNLVSIQNNHNLISVSCLSVFASEKRVFRLYNFYFLYIY